MADEGLALGGHGLPSAVADTLSIAAAGGYVTISFTDVLGHADKIIVATLVIFLLVLRIRTHLRRDAADLRDGRQARVPWKWWT